jgi:hypothetical protein
MHRYPQERHPSWESKIAETELKDFCKKIAITNEEENRLKIPEDKQGWATVTINAHDLRHLSHLSRRAERFSAKSQAANILICTCFSPSFFSTTHFSVQGNSMAKVSAIGYILYYIVTWRLSPTLWFVCVVCLHSEIGMLILRATFTA